MSRAAASSEMGAFGGLAATGRLGASGGLVAYGATVAPDRTGASRIKVERVTTVSDCSINKQKNIY